jgi:transposase
MDGNERGPRCARKRVDVYVEYAQKSATCPVCGELAGLHDRLEERSWRHLDTMQFITEIHVRTTPVCRVRGTASRS